MSLDDTQKDKTQENYSAESTVSKNSNLVIFDSVFQEWFHHPLSAQLSFILVVAQQFIFAVCLILKLSSEKIYLACSLPLQI